MTTGPKRSKKRQLASPARYAASRSACERSDDRMAACGLIAHVTRSPTRELVDRSPTALDRMARASAAMRLILDTTGPTPSSRIRISACQHHEDVRSLDMRMSRLQYARRFRQGPAMSRRHKTHIQEIRRSTVDESGHANTGVARILGRWTRWIARAPTNPLGRNSLKSGVGFAVPAVGLLVFTPVLVHLLGTANYGLWALSSSLLGLMGVLDLGLSVVVAKHVAQYRALGDVDSLGSSVTVGAAFY